MKNQNFFEAQFAQGAELPGQAEFIKAMESKIGDLLGSKLTGAFRMLVVPEGFHYGFTYGNNGYYNKNALVDIDRTLTIEPTTGQLTLGQTPFSTLNEKILSRTTYRLSDADQKNLNLADIAAHAYTKALIDAFKNDFPKVDLPSDVSAVATIFEYITEKYGSIDNVPVYYSSTKNALTDYSAHAAESYQMHSSISKAQARLASLINNINKPSKSNGGLQTDASSFYPGYVLPDFAQTFASLTTDSNKIDILLEFDQFNSKSSRLSIDHQAGFIIPLPVCVFGTSDTKYELNTLTTSQSTVSMQMSFKGITTIAPSPVLSDSTAEKGWYDETIIEEIVRNTGNDLTGYCLDNGEFNVKDTFGVNKKFSRLKQYVICQAPEITLSMKEIDTTAVSSLFKHNSKLDISFFGFGISSSTHSYSVNSVEVDTQKRSATITLGAPKPSATVSVETEVAYVLGGVASYPPSTVNDTMEKTVPFTCKLPEMLTYSSVSGRVPAFYHEMQLLPGSHTKKFYIGKVPSFSNASANADAILSIWYYYLPEENTIWLSDSQDMSSDKTRIELYNENGQVENILTNHSCTTPSICEMINEFTEELIHRAEEQGLSVVRRREIPDSMKNLYYRTEGGQYKRLGSTYWGIRTIPQRKIFANASGTSGDVFVDPSGTPYYDSWISIWEYCTMSQATVCTACQRTGKLFGAHVLLDETASRVPVAGEQVDILPLCPSCNHYSNTHAMRAAFSTTSVVMIW